MSTNSIFVFMGRPGSGKGVQSALLSEKLGLPIFSTGAQVREIAKKDSALGKRIREVSESGGLTPYWFASYLFEEAIFALGDEDGLICEGVGRKEPEARLFAEVNDWLRRPFTVFHLDVSNETVTQRLLKRREIEGRVDDEPEKIKVRLEQYESETKPALEYLRSIGKVVEIDGEPLPDQVFAQVIEKIN